MPLDFEHRNVFLLQVSHLHFVPQQTIRDLFDMNEGEKREAAVELAVPQPEEEEGSNKQSTTILEQVRHVTWDIVLLQNESIRRLLVVLCGVT